MMTFQDSDIDDIYEDFVEYPVYMAYLDKRKLQKCVMDFSTITICDDKKNRNQKCNIHIKCYSSGIHYGMDLLNKYKLFTLISGKKTFAKMFRNFKVDIREMCCKEAMAEVDFIIKNKSFFEIKRFKITKIKEESLKISEETIF